MATSPRVNLNLYLNDLDNYQRIKKTKDPKNRVNIPHYRKAAKSPHRFFIPDQNQISIASKLVLLEREKKYGPIAQPLKNKQHSFEYPNLEIKS